MSEKGKKVAFDWINENQAHIISISDSLWDYAELGLIEFKSAELLVAELEKHGFETEKGVAGMPTAFTGTWGKGKPVIGVMGEYDALPGLSQDKVPFKKPLLNAQPGHGCGHNIHGASGIAGAIALRYSMEENGLEGVVRFFGTPAEESASGKVWMVRANVFDGVDAVLSHHPGSIYNASLASSLANNSIKFHFHGKTSHAAGSPEQGRSALDAVELMNIGVNFLREHIIQDARIHYVIQEGGGQPNVVPGYARSWYLIRAPERSQVESIYNRVLKIAEGAALMTDTELQVEFLKAIYNKLPSRTLAEAVLSNMRLIGVPNYSEEETQFVEKISESITRSEKTERLRRTKRPGWEKLVDKVMDDELLDPWNEGEISHGSTDVSDVSWKAPTMEFSTATWPLGMPGHSWQIVACSAANVGHKSLIFASKVIAATGIDLLTKPGILEKAWGEHRERTMGKEYVSPLPEDAEPPLKMWDK